MNRKFIFHYKQTEVTWFDYTNSYKNFKLHKLFTLQHLNTLIQFKKVFELQLLKVPCNKIQNVILFLYDQLNHFTLTFHDFKGSCLLCVCLLSDLKLFFLLIEILLQNLLFPNCQKITRPIVQQHVSLRNLTSTVRKY